MPSAKIHPPSSPPKGPLVLLVLVLAASAVLLLYRLGDWETTEIMELLHLQSSKEMYLTGEWIVPSIFGQQRLRKPPLPNWAAAASAHLLGRFDLATARLPSVLAALLMIAMTFVLARRMFPMRHVGTFSALLLGGMYFLSGDQGRTAVWDIYVGAFSVGCLHACWRAMERPGRWALGWWLAAGVWLAAAGMSKGPVVLVIPLAVLIPMFVIDRCRGEADHKDLARRGVGVGVMIAVGIALCLPWIFALLSRIPDANRALVTWREEIIRDTPVAHVNHSPFYYLLFFGVIWPATPYAVAGLASTFVSAFRPHRRAMLFAFCWVVGGLALFTLAGERRMRYVIGLAPGAAIAAGALWARQREMAAKTETDGKTFALILLHWILIGVAVTAGPVFCAWKGWLGWAIALPIAAVGGMGAILGLRLHLRRRFFRAFAIGWAAAALAMMTCLSAYIDSPLTKVPEKQIATELLQIANERRIFYFPFRPSNAVGYYATQKYALRFLDAAKDQLARARTEGGAILLLGYRSESDFRKDPAAVLRSFERPVPEGFTLGNIRYAGHVVFEVESKSKGYQWYAVEMIPTPPATAPATASPPAEPAGD